ncbi:MAG: DUF58 domain-containing protein [Planctomycetota bacterium]
MLDHELLRKVREIEIATRRRVDEAFAGEYSSAFKGRGMEFDEVREYMPGDDVRSIDWNVTARAGTPYIKRFVEERELTVLLVVDLSASGIFGSGERSKNEMAAELCAVLAFAARRNNDKVGLIIYTDEVEHYVPPRKGRNHVLRIIRDVLQFEPGGRHTSANAALRHVRGVQRKSSVIFLISDFLEPGLMDAPPGAPSETWPADVALRLLCRRHDVVLVGVNDPRERALPNAGLVRLRDAETGTMRWVDTSSRRVRRHYQTLAHRRSRRLQEVTRKAGADLVEFVQGENYIRKLVELFHQRERRR